MTIENLSSLLLVSCVVLYTAALIAHAAEWAAARRPAPPSAPTDTTPFTTEPTDTSTETSTETAAQLTASATAPAAAAATIATQQTRRRSSATSPTVSDPAATVPGRVAADVAPHRGGSEPPPRVDLFGRIGIALTVLGFGFNLGGVVLRGIAADRAPWGNMLEFLTSAMVGVVATYLLLLWRSRARWLGLPVAMLAAVGNGLAVTVFYVAVAPLVPALQSVWFIIHIVAAAIAGAAFNIGGLASILYLAKRRAEKVAESVAEKRPETPTNNRARPRQCPSGYLRFLPPSARLDVLAYRCHAFAFPLWTFTVAAGAIWAEYAWGRYWGWDPKEVWALITWIAYACYLHARATAGWRGTKAAVVALIGLATFWFNFIGINLFVSGLHSYAGI